MIKTMVPKQSVFVLPSPPAELAGAAPTTRSRLASHSTDKTSASHPNQLEPALYQVYSQHFSLVHTAVSKDLNYYIRSHGFDRIYIKAVLIRKSFVRKSENLIS